MNAASNSDLLTAETTSAAKRRLSLFDLMLAMAAFALAMGLQQKFFGSPSSIAPEFSFWRSLFYAHAVGVNSLVLFGLMLLVWRRKKRGRGCATDERWHPGRLMLTMAVVNFFNHCAQTSLFWIRDYLEQQTIESSTDSALQAASFSIHWIALLLPLLIVVIGLMTRSMHRWWVATFVVVGLWQGLRVLINLALAWLPRVYETEIFQWHSRMQITMLIAALFIFISVGVDLTHKIPRDAAHGIGVVCLLGQSLVALLLLKSAIYFLGGENVFQM